MHTKVWPKGTQNGPIERHRLRGEDNNYKRDLCIRTVVSKDVDLTEMIRSNDQS